jgi:hypothetical protein
MIPFSAALLLVAEVLGSSREIARLQLARPLIAQSTTAKRLLGDCLSAISTCNQTANTRVP